MNVDIYDWKICTNSYLIYNCATKFRVILFSAFFDNFFLFLTAIASWTPSGTYFYSKLQYLVLALAYCGSHFAVLAFPPLYSADRLNSMRLYSCYLDALIVCLWLLLNWLFASADALDEFEWMCVWLTLMNVSEIEQLFEWLCVRLCVRVLIAWVCVSFACERTG